MEGGAGVKKAVDQLGCCLAARYCWLEIKQWIGLAEGLEPQICVTFLLCPASRPVMF